MRKATQQIQDAFICGKSLKLKNTFTDGKTICLFGNKIAEKTESGKVRISLAGWNTTTTRERLNGLKGVRISTCKGQAILNGMAWDGSWIEV